MKSTVLVILALSLTTAVFGDPRADEIIQATLNQKAPADMASTSTMTIVDQSGVTKVRKMKQVTKQTAETTRAFAVFVEPADVNGTKFLTISKKGSETDQRIYLPALKKVRKISSSSKDSEFLGSDLTYFDMEKRYFEDGTYTLLAEGQTLDGAAGLKLAKIETVFRVPSPYSKTVSWIDPVSAIPYRTDCYAKDGVLLKTITIDEVKALKGYLIISRSTIVNHKKGSSTVMATSDIALDLGVTDADVSLKRLEQ